jgi:hypothetical protein
MLEAKLAEIQSKAGKAEDKWEARVREYENRLRVAGEKIKTEKQGGKERALQLEGQVRWVWLLVIYSLPFEAHHSLYSQARSLASTPLPCLRLSSPVLAPNSANYQGIGTTGRFSPEAKCESRGNRSNSFPPDAIKLVVDGVLAIKKAYL